MTTLSLTTLSMTTLSSILKHTFATTTLSDNKDINIVINEELTKINNWLKKRSLGDI